MRANVWALVMCKFVVSTRIYSLTECFIYDQLFSSDVPTGKDLLSGNVSYRILHASCAVQALRS